MLRRLTLFIIAGNQLLLSVVFLNVAFLGAAYGGPLSPFLTLYGICGLVSACTLAFFGGVSRMIALIWNSIFAGYVFVNVMMRGLPSNKSEKVILAWAVVDLVAIFYLARIIFPSRKQSTS